MRQEGAVADGPLGTFNVARGVFSHPVFAHEPFTEREASIASVAATPSWSRLSCSVWSKGTEGPNDVITLAFCRSICRQMFPRAGVKTLPGDAELDALIYEACWYYDKKINPPLPLESFLDIAP
jgi:hypothetical protein